MSECKRCPYCGEEIMADARKCKHCGEWLDEGFVQEQDLGASKRESETDAKPKQNGPAVVPQSGLLKETTSIKKRKKWLLVIVPIVVVLVGVVLYLFGAFGNESILNGSQSKNGSSKFELKQSEDEIKAEIERLVLEAYKTYTNLDDMDGIILEESPDFRAAIEAESECEDASGFLCVDWDFYTVSQDPTCRRVSDVRAQIVDENRANVYVTLEDLCANERDSDSIIVILSMIRKNREGKWLVDDVDNTKELMIECAKGLWEEMKKGTGEEDYDEKEEDESTLNLEHVSYEDYNNTRFGFYVSYPSFFRRKSESYNQDGCEFLYGKNYSITVYGMNNSSESSIIELFESGKKSTDSYSAQKDNWFVLSGINEEGNIYYEKTILENDIVYGIELVYPQEKKSKYEAVLKRVVGSFEVFGSTIFDSETED